MNRTTKVEAESESLWEFHELASVTLCDCGRKRMPIHCHRCGSRNVYLRKRNASHVTLRTSGSGTGISFRAEGFCCRKCGCNFNDLTPCGASRERERERESWSRMTKRNRKNAAAREKRLREKRIGRPKKTWNFWTHSWERKRSHPE